MSKKDKRYLQKALELAKRSDCKQKHGAIVVRSGNVLSVGWNRYLNDAYYLPRTGYTKWCSRHAEAHALRQITDPRGCVLYVARLTKSGSEGLSEPCGNCSDLISRLGIKKVVYT